MKNREPFKLKYTTRFWNLFLAVFSIIGSIRTVPILLLHVFDTSGWVGSLCWEGEYVNMASMALWTMLFVHSKYLEFVDTVLLILKKKPIIFLHWWHHFTVMLYCWNGSSLQITGGIVYAPMNYFVHSVMYSYYFLMACGIKVPRGWAKYVTYIQILQMVIGIFTVLSHFVFWTRVPNCDGSIKDFGFAFLIYCSYLVLFLKFFIGKYFAGPTEAAKKPKKALVDEKKTK